MKYGCSRPVPLPVFEVQNEICFTVLCCWRSAFFLRLQVTGWQLSDGSKLDDWTKVGGEAIYVIKEGVITGTTGAWEKHIPNTWSLFGFCFGI